MKERLRHSLDLIAGLVVDIRRDMEATEPDPERQDWWLDQIIQESQRAKKYLDWQ
jgi:hypothetical protein